MKNKIFMRKKLS